MQNEESLGGGSAVNASDVISPPRDAFGDRISYGARLRSRIFQDRAAVRKNTLLLGEIGLLLLWALLLAWPYLNFDTRIYPNGVDYPAHVHYNHVWTRAKECGLCAMWYGASGGGSPAFANLHPSVLHPLTMVTTLGWGVVNGSKIALLGIFFMAGVAQWWLARVVGLGAVARLWSGAMAVVAGNLAGRMDMGWLIAALSTAACMLVIPPLVQVCLTGSRRVAILLGFTLACAAFAGLGYMQFGLILTFPAALVLLPWGKPEFRLVARRLGLAAGLALLISAPFLVPFATSYSQFGKEGDVDLRGAIPLAFMSLGFVMHNPDFFRTHELGMQGFPALYVNYVGWLPIIFSIVAIRAARAGKQFRVLVYLLLVLLLILLGSSLEPRAWLAQSFPDSWLSSLAERIRSAPIIAGLAVMPLLGLAALGLDFLMKRLSGEVRVGVNLRAGGSSILSFNPNWLLLIPLLWGLNDVRSASSYWIWNQELRGETYPVLRALKTPDTQWVYFPEQNFYLEPATGMGLKMPWIGLPEFWKDKSLPPAYRNAELEGDPPSNMKVINRVRGVRIYEGGIENSYALVANDTGDMQVCSASGIAGDIDVKCDLEQGGTLVVKENSWAGWGATIDGEPAELGTDRWLSVNVPPGEHLIQFRYRPWDFPLGVLLSLVGIVLAVYLWRKPDLEQIEQTE